jgi:hypothetical protein
MDDHVFLSHIMFVWLLEQVRLEEFMVRGQKDFRCVRDKLARSIMVEQTTNTENRLLKEEVRHVLPSQQEPRNPINPSWYPSCWNRRCATDTEVYSRETLSVLFTLVREPQAPLRDSVTLSTPCSCDGSPLTRPCFTYIYAY